MDTHHGQEHPDQGRGVAKMLLPQMKYAQVGPPTNCFTTVRSVIHLAGQDTFRLNSGDLHLGHTFITAEGKSDLIDPLNLSFVPYIAGLCLFRRR